MSLESELFFLDPNVLFHAFVIWSEALRADYGMYFKRNNKIKDVNNCKQGLVGSRHGTERAQNLM